MAGSHPINRRDFVKLVTALVGTAIGAGIGLPAIAYLIDPALKPGAKQAWVTLGPLQGFKVGQPTLVSFTRSTVNGWEKTTNSYGVYVVRKSDTEVEVLSNKCTHLGCRVNWNGDRQAYVCPCHDGTFDTDGKVLGGPPPRPLDRYEGDALKIDNGLVMIFFSEG